jgi:hypothetical protein
VHLAAGHAHRSSGAGLRDALSIAGADVECRTELDREAGDRRAESYGAAFRDPVRVAARGRDGRPEWLPDRLAGHIADRNATGVAIGVAIVERHRRHVPGGAP